MKKVRGSLGDRIFLCIVYALVFAVTLIVLYPLIYIVSCSFSDPTVVSGGRVWLWPVDFTLIGYKRVFQEKSISIQLRVP